MGKWPVILLVICQYAAKLLFNTMIYSIHAAKVSPYCRLPCGKVVSTLKNSSHNTLRKTLSYLSWTWRNVNYIAADCELFLKDVLSPPKVVKYHVRNFSGNYQAEELSDIIESRQLYKNIVSYDRSCQLIAM